MDAGVRVRRVRPGFVRTKMTQGLTAAPFSVGPERVATEVAAALQRGDEIVWVPPILRLVMRVVLLLPRGFLRRL